MNMNTNGRSTLLFHCLQKPEGCVATRWRHDLGPLQQLTHPAIDAGIRCHDFPRPTFPSHELSVPALGTDQRRKQIRLLEHSCISSPLVLARPAQNFACFISSRRT